MKNELEQMAAEKEAALADKEKREHQFQFEKEKLKAEMEKWKGEFETIRETETERLKREEEEEEKRKEEYENEKEAKEREIEELRKEQERILAEKNEKEAKSDALDSMMGELIFKVLKALSSFQKASEANLKVLTLLARRQQIKPNPTRNLSKVRIRRCSFFKPLRLFLDVRDTYEDKLASLAKKCEQWRREADKQNETAKRLREERNKCKCSFCLSNTALEGKLSSFSF